VRRCLDSLQSLRVLKFAMTERVARSDNSQAGLGHTPAIRACAVMGMMVREGLAHDWESSCPRHNPSTQKVTSRHRSVDFCRCGAFEFNVVVR
jgi:hypothetical protein